MNSSVGGRGMGFNETFFFYLFAIKLFHVLFLPKNIYYYIYIYIYILRLLLDIFYYRLSVLCGVLLIFRFQVVFLLNECVHILVDLKCMMYKAQNQNSIPNHWFQTGEKFHCPLFLIMDDKRISSEFICVIVVLRFYQSRKSWVIFFNV